MSTEFMTLSDCVIMMVDRYVEDLDGDAPHNLHAQIIEQVERALLDHTMKKCAGQRSTAAQWLGINRNTLRKKLQNYGLDT
ncbi:helix-turn-helix domain-containing protein [Acidithiobacillus montserratensis]|uniref:Helix-turn-helix domain-containing protein n=1 Tax=Acidithiobacillus montserratensis TaxID=2729135 RepID=A0ACD5HEQ6_9PROT|nr:helix-turn-helix domain-containing protein [Acidithiobacillus montserratensis]MBN2680079.1 Fis family transcriptional regulator [Acidithiobacillaceae bacterium]MBU2747892.1 Fis family transcriptional regulator [Acidithiobacillus montserratensis]